MTTGTEQVDRIRTDPVPLLAWVMIAVVGVGVAHLIVDVVAWTGGGVMGQLDGIANDGLSVVEGVAVIGAALAVFVARGGAYPSVLEPARGTLSSLLDGSPTALPRMAWLVAYLGVVKTGLALWSDRGGDVLRLLSTTAHDLTLTAFVAAVVIALVAIATRQAGVRLDVLAWAAVGVPVGGVLHAFLTLIGGDDAGREFGEEFPELMYDLLEVATVTTVVLALVVIVSRHSSRSPAEVLSFLPEALRDPGRMIGVTRVAAAVFGVLVVATRLAEADGGGDVTMYVLSSGVRDAVVLIGIAMVAAAVARSDPAPGSLVWLTVAAVVAGVLAAVFVVIAFDFYDGDQRLYWFLNELFRTSLGVGALLLSAALLLPALDES